MLTYQLEKAVYKAGINVHLERAEKHKVYKMFESNLQEFFYRQVKKVAQADIENLMLLTKFNAPAELVLQISVILGDLLAESQVDLQTYMYWAGSQGGKAALDKLNLAGSFYLENKEVTDYFDDYARLRLQSVDDTTKEWIAQQIQNGKQNAMSPAAIATEMRDAGLEMSQYRAETIVLTETAFAMGYVEKEAAKRYGIKELIWRTSKDDRVDPICLDLEGKKFAVNAMFDYPAHPRCRCYLEEVIPETWVVPEQVWLGE